MLQQPDAQPAETLPLIYRDQQLVVVHKPSGLLVHRSNIDRYEHRFALQIIRNQIGQHVFPVHRLDKPTSGLLLMALSPETARALAAQFEQGLIRKQYLAIVRGHTHKGGIIRHPIRDPDAPRGKDAPALPALSVYRRLASCELPVALDGRHASSRFSLVQIAPCTGRRHQIRKHFKHIHHPLVGDANYGKGVINRYFRDELGSDRLLLAAIRLELTHPVSGKRLLLECPLAEDFKTTAIRLGWAL